MNDDAPLAKLLPYAAAQMLYLAAQTAVTLRDPLARVKAVERAIARVRHEWPMYFR